MKVFIFTVLFLVGCGTEGPNGVVQIVVDTDTDTEAETDVEKTLDEPEYQLSAFTISEPTYDVDGAQITWSASEEESISLVGGVVTYDLDISTTSDCSSPISDGSYTGVSSTSQVLETLAVGTYYACITAKGNNKQKDAANSPYRFEVSYSLVYDLGYSLDDEGKGYHSGQTKPANYSANMLKGVGFTDADCTSVNQLYLFSDGVVEESGNNINTYTKQYWIDSGCSGY